MDCDRDCAVYKREWRGPGHAPHLKPSVAPWGWGPSAIRILGPLIFKKHKFLSNIYRFFNVVSFHLKILFGLNTTNPRARFGLSGLWFVISSWPKRTAREGADQDLIRIGGSGRWPEPVPAAPRCCGKGPCHLVPLLCLPGEAPRPACLPQLAMWWKGAHMGHSCGRFPDRSSFSSPIPHGPAASGSR